MKIEYFAPPTSGRSRSFALNFVGHITGIVYTSPARAERFLPARAPLTTYCGRAARAARAPHNRKLSRAPLRAPGANQYGGKN